MESHAKGISGDLSRVGWERRYENQETGWDRGAPNPALFKWLADKKLRPCRIIIPCCGFGHEVITLARRGFQVTALDFAPTPASHLAQQLLAASAVANVIREDIRTFDPCDKFDAVYEQTCLCALDPDDWELYEQRIRLLLRPGGKVFALFLQSSHRRGPPFNCPLRSMKALFAEDRWLWMNEQFIVDHPSGMSEIAIVLQLREKS